MTTDRFEQNLRAVLREQAPGQAPQALHLRVTEIAGQAATARGSTVAPLPRVVWVLLAAALLTAFAVGAIFLVSMQDRFTRHPQALVPTGVESLTPVNQGFAQVVSGRDGFVWAYGQGRLMRLDPGTGAKRFWAFYDDAVFASGAFASGSIVAAREGGVWLVGTHALHWFDGDQFRDVVEAPAEVTRLAYAAEAADGTLWATAWGQAVFHWDGSSWTSVPIPGAVGSSSVDRVAVDRDGGVWVVLTDSSAAGSRGVARYAGGAWRTYTSGDVPPLSGEVLSIAAAPDGSVWVVTRTGVARFDGRSWSTFGEADIGFAHTGSVAFAPDGTVWAESTSVGGGPWNPIGLARYDGRAWVVSRPEGGLPEGYWSGSLALTKDGLFVATGTGLFRLVADRWEPASTMTVALGGVTPSQLAAVSGEELLAFYDQGASGVSMLRWRAGSWIRQESAGSPIYATALVPDGTLWAATEQGPAYLHNGSWTIVPGTGISASAIAFGGDGSLWVGGWAESGPSLARVLQSGSATWTPGKVIEGYPFGWISSLAVDRNGTVWAGGASSGWFPDWTNGLARYDGRAWETVRPLGGSADVGVQKVAVAPNGDVWVALDGAYDSAGNALRPPAIARWDGTSWTVFGQEDGLTPGAYFQDLAVAPDGTVWVSTYNGLARFDGARWTLLFPGHGFGGRISVAPDGTIFAVGASGIERLPAQGE